MILRQLAIFLLVFSSIFGQAQVLNLGDGDGLDIGDVTLVTGNLTVEAWINTGVNFANIVSKDSAGVQSSFRLRPTQFSINTYDLGNGGDVTEYAVTSSVLIDDTRWHHVAGVYDGSFLYFYLNGCLTSKRDAIGQITNTTIPAFIGKESFTTGAQFVGLMDELQIWDVARSEGEIKQDMQGLTNPVAVPNLLAYYDFTTDFDNQKNPGVYTGVPLGNPSIGTNTDVKPASFSIIRLDLIGSECSNPVGSVDVFGSTPVSRIAATKNPQDLTAGSTLNTLFSGTYNVLVEDEFGCRVDTTVFIDGGGITQTTVSYNEPICSGSTLFLSSSATDAGITSFEWTGVGAFTDANPNASISNAQKAQKGVYTLEVQNAAGCIQRNSLFVAINGIDGAPRITSNAPVCEFGDLILDTPVTGAVYTWQGPNSYFSRKKQSYKPDMTFADGGSYTLRVIKDGCTSPLSSENIGIIGAPFPPTIYSNQGSFCFGDTVFLFADPVMSAEFDWSGPNFKSNLQSPFIAPSNDGDSGTYYCTITTNGGCPSDSATLEINVFEDTKPDFGPDSTFCHTDELTLFPGSYQDYMWHDGSTQPIFNVMEGDTIWVTVRDQNSCITTDSLTLEPFCPGKIFVPNAFSPNGDRYNGIFKVEGINISDFDFKIYTRGGQLIFETKNVNEGWDGFINNIPARQDTYIWILKYTQRRLSGVVESEKNGSVILLR
ncbi:MAG: gliding motility-associated-like protein [Luteibaculaceae bacterium]|jgi:gliding motility-associated-like protein